MIIDGTANSVDVLNSSFVVFESDHLNLTTKTLFRLLKS